MNIKLHNEPSIARASRSYGRAAFASVLVMLVLLLSACDSNDEGGVIGTGIMDGGIIGTGFALRGTASENRQFARAEVDARPPSLTRSSGQIAPDGQFTVETAETDSVWLLRTDLGNNQYRFGIAFNENNAHVHSYTDAALRNWFLREHSVQDLNTFFESAADLRYPTEEEYRANALQLLSYVKPALRAYGLETNEVLDNTFRADGTGIDRYLDNNPVVLNNDSITILLTEPNIEIQSINRSGLLLSQRFDPADSVKPSTPDGLQALGSDSDKIILIWEPTVDNTAVVDYQIYRDNIRHARTAFPVFIDEGVQAGASHQYEISAIDLLGNESARSIAVIGMPLSGGGGPGELMQPAAPSNLTEVLATPSSVELRWSQNPVAGVVAFNVYRGDDGASPTLLVKVTGNELTDATVTGGTSYLYEVRAVGPTGVESAASESLNVLTTGIVIVTPINNSGVPALAGLTIPNTQSLDCSTDFSSYDIRSETTIAAGCYQVTQNIVVERFGALILSPGVVLKFAEGTELQVLTGGAIESLGIPAQPVVLSGAQPEQGYWNGVHLIRSDSRRNKIINTVIEYTGWNDQDSGINTQTSTGVRTRLAMDNTLIRFGDGGGFNFIGKETEIDSFSGNLITQNRETGSVSIGTIQSLGDGSDLKGNDDPQIDVASLTVDFDVRIPNLEVPIKINGIDQAAGTMIIEAGTELRFQPGRAFRVRGELKLDGTPENPVQIRVVDPNVGKWAGFHLTDGAIVEFNNAIIKQAGEVRDADAAIGQNPFGAAVYANDARISFTNVTLSESTGPGLHVTSDDVKIDKFERVRLSDNAIPARIGLSHLDAFGSSPTISGNVDDRIDVEQGNSVGNVVWHNAGVDYRINGLYEFTAGIVAIGPGVSIKAAPESELLVTGAATLEATGAFNDPILMTGLDSSRGQWAGVTVETFRPNVIRYVLIRHAGGASKASADPNQNGALNVNCSAASQTILNLSNTRLQDSGSWGLFISEDGCRVGVGGGVEFFDNAIGESNR